MKERRERGEKGESGIRFERIRRSRKFSDSDFQLASFSLSFDVPTHDRLDERRVRYNSAE